MILKPSRLFALAFTMAAVPSLALAAPTAVAPASSRVEPATGAQQAPPAAPSGSTGEVPAPAEATVEPGARPVAPETRAASQSASANPADVAPGAKPKPEVKQATEPLAPEHIGLAMAPLSWDREPGRGLLFGGEIGLWGLRQGSGVRVGYGFARHFAAHLRGVITTEQMEDVEAARSDVGVRLDLIGRSQPILNVVRLYGGGGFQVFTPAFNLDGRSKKPVLRGGGQFGFEFFQSPWTSFFLEVGGQGGPAPGATILAGLMFYRTAGSGRDSGGY